MKCRCSRNARKSKTLTARQADIVSGEGIVFVEDECHVLWGDTLGYVWSRRHERLVIPRTNVNQRQPYDGVMNLYNQEFTVTPDERGNGENTVSFLQSLQALHPDKKLIIIWERARYHGGNEMQAYLSTVNQGLEAKDGKVTCLLFAPNAPDQNPVEAIWLQGKHFLRRHFYENKTFQPVKQSLFKFLKKQVFNFEKSKWYLESLQLV